MPSETLLRLKAAQAAERAAFRTLRKADPRGGEFGRLALEYQRAMAALAAARAAVYRTYDASVDREGAATT